MFHFNSHLGIFTFSIFCIYFMICKSEVNSANNIENDQNFTNSPKTIKTFVNNTVVLPCFLNVLFQYVRWHKDEVLLADSRHLAIGESEHVQLYSNGTLQISYVQPEDSGYYYCEMITSFSHETIQKYSLDVQSPATVFTEPRGILELPIGATLEIICEAMGIPKPNITWRHNGHAIDKYQNGNRQQHLVEIKSRHMSGSIECMATNGVGDIAVDGVYLTVLFAPEIYTTKKTVYTKINARVSLECIVLAAPLARVRWFFNGVPITFNFRLSHHDSETYENRTLLQNYTKMKHTLLINNIRIHDFGLYECRAENIIGTKSIYINLTGRPSPCIFKINHRLQNSVFHALVWQTESLSPILEYKLKFRQIPSGNSSYYDASTSDWTELTIPSEITTGSIHTKSYTLRGLQPASIYEVTVLARNHFGWNENSKILRFATGGEVEMPNYSTEFTANIDSKEQTSEEVSETVKILLTTVNRSEDSLFEKFSSTTFIGIYIVMFILKISM